MYFVLASYQFDYKTLIYDTITFLTFNQLDALCSKQYIYFVLASYQFDYKTLIYDVITLLPFDRLDALCSKR